MGDTTIKVKVTADDGVVTRTYTLTVTRETPSTDLSALSVGGESVAGFDAETTSYQFGVASAVTQVTVAGVAPRRPPPRWTTAVRTPTAGPTDTRWI